MVSARQTRRGSRPAAWPGTSAAEPSARRTGMGDTYDDRVTPAADRATRGASVAVVSRHLVRAGFLAVVVALPLALTATPASAHDSVVGTQPTSGATLSVAPTSVVLHLEEPPAELGNSIAVTAPGGASVTSGDTTITGSDVSVALVPLTADGVYRVAYRIVSDDGHPVTGAYTWTLATGAPTAPSSPSPSAAPASSSTSTTWWLPAALIAVALALGAALVARRRRSGAS